MIQAKIESQKTSGLKTSGGLAYMKHDPHLNTVFGLMYLKEPIEP